MCQTYSGMGPENKFEIECAPSLGEDMKLGNLDYGHFCSGFYKADYYLVSQTVQFELRNMTRLAVEECILVSDIRPDTITFSMK